MKKLLVSSMLIAIIFSLVSFKKDTLSSQANQKKESTTLTGDANYKIIYKQQTTQFEAAVSDLTADVNNAIKEGYKPIGGVGTLGYMAKTYIYQAVIK